MTTDAAGAALTDPGTATLLGVYRRRVRSARKSVWLWPLVFVAWLALFLSSAPSPDTAGLVLAVVWVAIVAVVTTSSALVLARLGRWLSVAEVVLANEPWRPVTATVISWDRRPVLELAEFGCVRLMRGTTALLRTIELTGGVDIAGPGPSGWVALRVAGSCWPLPARVLASTPARTPRPPVEDAVAQAADPITASVATIARRRVLLLFILPAVIVAVGAAFIGVGIAASDSGYLVVVGACLLALGVVSVVKTLPTARTIAGLPARLAGAPWTAYPVQLDQWQAPRGFVTATGHLRTPYDDVLAFELPRANYDLLVAISMTGTMHVAGTPKPGATLPVGVPERPVLGYVRFRAAGARR